MSSDYPKAMYRSVEDMLTVHDEAEEKAARADGYEFGGEFWTKFNAGQAAPAPKPPKEPKVPKQPKE